jgi:hypothetical protein
MSKKIILTFILAVIVGFIGGLQGNAGSLYMLGGLMALGIVDSQKIAAGTTLLVTALPITIGSAYEYYKHGDVDVLTAFILCFVGFIFSILGSKFNYLISQKTTEYSIAITMAIGSIYFFWSAYYMD